MIAKALSAPFWPPIVRSTPAKSQAPSPQPLQQPDDVFSWGTWSPEEASHKESVPARQTKAHVHTGFKLGAALAMALLAGCASMGGAHGLEGYDCVPPAPYSQVMECHPRSAAHEAGQAIHDAGQGVYHEILVPVGHGFDNFFHGLVGKPARF